MTFVIFRWCVCCTVYESVYLDKIDWPLFEGRIQSRNNSFRMLYLFQILLPPDAGGAAAPLGGSHDLQRRHLAAQVHEEGHGKRLYSS
jgi:hypothetical protein